MEINATKQQHTRDYLLGQMPAEQRSPFEELLLTNDESYQELLIVEDELFDDYLSDKLSASERESFESHFIAPPERQSKLRFARTFRKYVVTNAKGVEEEGHPAADDHRADERPEARAVRPPSLRGWWGFLPVRNPLLGYAMAAAVILIFVGVSWVVWRNFNASPRDPGRVLTVILTPGLVRDDTQQTTPVSVARDTGTVRLQLLLDRRYPSYEADLVDSEGRSLSTQSNVKSEMVNDTPAAVVDIPAKVLRAGDYRIKLSGFNENGKREDLPTYYFRVQTP